MCGHTVCQTVDFKTCFSDINRTLERARCVVIQMSEKRPFAAHWLHHFSACKHVPSQSRVGFVSSSSRPRPSRAATPFEGCDLPGTVDTYEAPRLHAWGFSFQHDR